MSRAWGMWALVIGACCGLLSCMTGCAATGAERIDNARAVLDSTATVVDTLYQTAVVTCDTTARMMIERAGGREEAEQINAEIKAKCQALYDTFGAVKLAHDAALDLVTRVEDGRADPADLMSALTHLAAVAIQAQQAWASLKAVLHPDAPIADPTSMRLMELHQWASAERQRWAS